MDIKKTLHMNVLFSYYKPLLTDKQQEYMQLYYSDDLSLGEIAEIYKVSRQAVHDTINRTEKTMETYEEKLHIISDTIKQAERVETLKEYVLEHYPDDANLSHLINQLTK